MADVMNDFLDFGDDQEDTFVAEYASFKPYECSPSSDDLDLNPMENSMSELSSTGKNDVESRMSNYTTGASSWTGVNDSFSQMHVKAEPLEKSIDSYEDGLDIIPGSWPIAQNALKNHGSSAQSTRPRLPANFTMSQIAPPSLPQERSNASSSAMYSEVIMEETENASDAKEEVVEPARKRRASEIGRKIVCPLPKNALKRSPSMEAAEISPAMPVNEELDESGDPIIARRQDRLMRNRAAALASRERKREHVMKLETTVADLESAKGNLQSQVQQMYTEILRLRKLLSDNDIEDTESAIIESDTSLSSSMSASPERITVSSALPENPQLNRAARPPPTGFSPRGALKKEEIIANQLKAEEHLRNVTRKLAESGSSAEKEDFLPAIQGMAPSTKVERQSKTSNSGGSVVFMILIFGIALFANTNSSGSLDLKGFSSDRGELSLLLNLPQNIGEACPETVISQLRGQGFMLSHEVAARSLLSSRRQSAAPTTSIANWVAPECGNVQYKIGSSLTIATPTSSEAKETWKVLDCQIKSIHSSN